MVRFALSKDIKMLTLNFTPMKIRPKPSADRVAQIHCALISGKVGSYATSSTKVKAQALAVQLASIRVHAMSEVDAKAYKATYTGIPSHYRLARGVS